jgi:hypothetical protein
MLPDCRQEETTSRAAGNAEARVPASAPVWQAAVEVRAPQVAVVICTWNRQHLLRQALAQLTRLQLPAGLRWEVLVVNNNCTDATDQVLAEFAARLPLRRLYEPQQGLSHARNLAVREARAAYLAWTDDDTQVEPDWLSAYLDAFARWPGAALFGGPITTHFLGSPPRWLQRTFAAIPAAYAQHDLGAAAVALDAQQLPLGANYAVQTAMQRRFPYDPALGRCGTGLLSGEEHAVFQRLLAAGAAGWWVPQARVRHCIPPERQTTRYLRGYYQGIGEVVGRQMPSEGERLWRGRPLWLWRQTVTAQLKYWVRRPFCGPESWVADLVAANLYRGRLRGFAQSQRVA